MPRLLILAILAGAISAPARAGAVPVDVELWIAGGAAVGAGDELDGLGPAIPVEVGVAARPAPTLPGGLVLGLELAAGWQRRSVEGRRRVEWEGDPQSPLAPQPEMGVSELPLVARARLERTVGPVTLSAFGGGGLARATWTARAWPTEPEVVTVATARVFELGLGLALPLTGRLSAGLDLRRRLLRAFEPAVRLDTWSAVIRVAARF